jgi:hypothetical protein
VTSDTEWERAGITGVTVTAMIGRGLIELGAGRSLRGWVGLMAIIGRIHRRGRRIAMVKATKAAVYRSRWKAPTASPKRAGPGNLDRTIGGVSA